MPRSVSWWWSGIFCRKPSIAEPGSEEGHDRTRSSTALDRAPVRTGIDQSLVFYREPTAVSEATLRLMRLIDEQFLETPWYGSRQMARHLRRTLEEAIARFGRPEIFNTDQGSQFTGFAFTDTLKGADIASRWMVVARHLPLLQSRARLPPPMCRERLLPPPPVLPVVGHSPDNRHAVYCEPSQSGETVV
jgi:hypothetical protein